MAREVAKGAEVGDHEVRLCRIPELEETRKAIFEQEFYVHA